MASERSGGAAAPAGRRTRWIVFVCLTGGLFGAMLLSLGLGEVAISPDAVAGILLRHLGWTGVGSFSSMQDGVLWTLRLPRVLLGALVGGSLGLAGATLQGLLRNPLADPALLGSSSGAALGTVLLLLIGGSALGLAALLPAAFGGSLLATAAVYLVALHQGRTDVLTMVLAGVVVNALVAGVVGLLIAATNNPALNSVTYWELGSLAGANWDDVYVLAPLTLAGLLFLSRWTRALNLLAIGDRDARYLGVNVTRARAILLAVVSLLTAATVAVAGIVAFVGLVVPHLLRQALGPDHTALLPASALGGALLVVLTDLLARTLAAPAEIPLGSLTAILGCPFLLWLLRRGHLLHGRWA